jgi:hypothetical protein
MIKYLKKNVLKNNKKLRKLFKLIYKIRITCIYFGVLSVLLNSGVLCEGVLHDRLIPRVKSLTSDSWELFTLLLALGLFTALNSLI